MDRVLNLLSFSAAPSYTVSGNFSYYLDVTVKGDAPYQTSTLSLTAYTKSNKKIAIAVSCKWYRVFENRQYCLSSIHSNTYQLTAEDLGSTLKVEVSPLEDDQTGIATVTYGPIRLDPNVRNTVENILSAGGSKFTISLVNEETGEISNDTGYMSVTNDSIFIVETPARGKEKQVKFKYSYDLPKIELNYQDANRLVIHFKGDEDEIEDVKKFVNGKKGSQKIGAKFLSRTSRDLFIIAIKCFAMKNYLINSKVINEINFTEEGKIFDDKNKSNKVGDWLLEVDSVKREMNLVLSRNSELARDKETLQTSIIRLEEELSSTIETYSQLISELKNAEESRGFEGTPGNPDTTPKKWQDLEDENKKLSRKIRDYEEKEKSNANSSKKYKTPHDHDDASILKDFENLAKGKENFSLQYEMKIQELEENCLELKLQNDQLLDQLKNSKGKSFDSPIRFGKAKSVPNDDSLFLIETKLNDTKKLNEMLIKEVNSQKSKNESLQKEINLLRNELNKLREDEEAISLQKERITKERIRSLEEQLSQVKKDSLKNSDSNTSEELNRALRENSELKSKINDLNRQLSLKLPLNEGQDDKQISQLRFNIENLIQEISAWKSKYSNLELELAKSKDAQDKSFSNDNKLSLNQNIESILNRSSYAGPKNRETLLEDTIRENDKIYTENLTLKSRVTVLEIQYQMAKSDVENLKKNSNTKNLEKELESCRAGFFDLKSKCDQFYAENEKLKAEISSAKRTNIVPDTIRIEAENLKRENEGMKSEIAVLKSFEKKFNDLKNDNDILLLETNNLKNKKESLSNEVEYLRNEVTTLRQAMISPMNSPSKSNDYKLRFEELSDKYDHLQSQYNMLKDQLEQSSTSASLDIQRNLLNEIQELRMMNDLLQKEILDYKERLDEIERGGKYTPGNDEFIEREKQELRKEIKNLQSQLSAQRDRIQELERENESLKHSKGSLDKSVLEDNVQIELERLRSENEALLLQRNQLSKSIDTLKKELDSKVNVKGNQALLDNLAKTNERLIQENAKLMDQIRSINDELDAYKNSSRLESSRYDESDNPSLRERVKDLEIELGLVVSERDKLLVEVSRMMAQEKKKGIFS